MKRRIFSVVLSIALAASVLGGCQKTIQSSGSGAGKGGGSDSGVGANAGADAGSDAGSGVGSVVGADAGVGANAGSGKGAGAADKKLKIVYLCNGSLGDKGFNDSAARGMKFLEERMGAETKVIEMGREETGYEGNYLDVSEQDWDFIVSGTWSVKELAQNIAVQYPEKQYLLFDSQVDRQVVDGGNMMGISYIVNQSAYLSGVLAARMLESGDGSIDPSKKILGFVGSMDVTLINDFYVGYAEGIKSVDPDIKILTSYVGTYEDVSKCMEMTTQLYNQGAQIVFAPASQSILGAVTAASKAGKYVIGCDQDLYEELADSDPKLAACVLSSSVKNVDESIYAAVEGWINGTMTLDQDYPLGLESGAVGLAKNENYNKLVPKDIQKAIQEAEQKIISGEIKVKTAFEMTTDEIAAYRDSMKP